jgi:hypothetical protein
VRQHRGRVGFHRCAGGTLWRCWQRRSRRLYLYRRGAFAGPPTLLKDIPKRNGESRRFRNGSNPKGRRKSDRRHYIFGYTLFRWRVGVDRVQRIGMSRAGAEVHGFGGNCPSDREAPFARNSPHLAKAGAPDRDFRLGDNRRDVISAAYAIAKSVQP